MLNLITIFTEIIVVSVTVTKMQKHKFLSTDDKMDLTNLREWLAYQAKMLRLNSSVDNENDANSIPETLMGSGVTRAGGTTDDEESDGEKSGGSTGEQFLRDGTNTNGTQSPQIFEYDNLDDDDLDDDTLYEKNLHDKTFYEDDPLAEED